MPIRFVNAYSRLGRASPVLADLSAVMVGDIAEPVVFTGSVSRRLDDLSSRFTGQYILDSSVAGSLSVSLTGVSGLVTGSVIVNPLYPPASVGLEIL